MCHASQLLSLLGFFAGFWFLRLGYIFMEILLKIKPQDSLGVIVLASQVMNPWKKVVLMERLTIPKWRAVNDGTLIRVGENVQCDISYWTKL